MMWRNISIILGILLSTMYISINVFIPLPVFLIFENLMLALLYVGSTIYLYRAGCPVPLLVLSTFNLGRLSRSLISPTGDIPPLAASHLPLFILILALVVSTLYGLIKVGVHTSM